MIGVAIAGVLLNALFVEIIPIEFIGKLQFQRIMPFGHIAAALAIAMAVCLLLQRGAPSNSVLLAVAISLLAVPSVIGTLAWSVLKGEYLNFLSTLGLTLGTVLFFLPNARIRHGLVAAVAVTTVFLNTPLVSYLPLPSAIKKQYGVLYDERRWEAPGISTWLRINTGQDALILIPPDWSIMSETLGLHSRRALYFSFKNVPYSDSGVYEWSRRAERLIGHPVTEIPSDSLLRDLWQRRSNSEVISIMEEVDACYLVDRIADRPDMSLDEVFRSEPNDRGEAWAIWRLNDCPSGAR